MCVSNSGELAQTDAVDHVNRSGIKLIKFENNYICRSASL